MKILVVLSRVPWPLEKGDKLRAYHLIREWSKTNEIVLFCLTDEAVDPHAETKLREICAEVSIHRFGKWDIAARMLRGVFLNSLPFQVNYFYSKRLQKKFDQFLEQNLPGHIFCQLARTAEYVRKYSTLNKSIDYMDAFSTGMQRMATKAQWPVSSLMNIEYKRLKAYEQEIQFDFKNKFIISEQDKEQLSYVERIEVIPNGIDPVFTQNHPGVKDKKYDILFTGNMAYRPNVESAKFLVTEIMPIVWKTKPSVTVCLAGATPTAAIKALANDRVIVTGWVEDISQVYRRSEIFVAPMIVNTGLQNKLLEAMACNIPSVTTTLANNALGAEPNKEIKIGDNTKQLAEAIVELTDNKEMGQQIARSGKDYVLANFSWEKSAKAFSDRF